MLVELLGDRDPAPPLTGAASAKGGDGSPAESLAAPARDNDAPPPPHRTPSVLDRWRQSPWSQTAWKAAGILATMTTLSVIGMWAIAAEPRRGSPPPPEPPGSTWLASDSDASHELDGGVSPDKAVPARRLAADGGDAAAPDARARPSTKAASSATPSPTTSPGATSDGKVVLNTAGLRELMQLPGVGPKRAEAILRLREKLGRFRRPTELLRVKGIGPKSLKKLLPHLVLDPPPEG